MDLKSTYDQIAEDWNKEHKDSTWWVAGTDKFISFLKPGARVLDIGCGPGIKSKYLLDKGLDIVGIDFSEKMIEIAKREVPLGKFYVKDIYDLKSFDEMFDGIFAQAVLLHVPKNRIKEVLKNLVAKLNTQGCFYVAVKQIRSDEKDERLETEDNYGYSYERFFSYFSLDEIKKFMSDVGLTVRYEDISRFGRTDWIQVIGTKE